VQNEDPVDLTVTLPAGSRLDGAEVRGFLDGELRTRAEVTAADSATVVVRAYRREEVDSVAEELIIKLSKMERVDGCTVRWTDENGVDVVRPVE
jgi:hypothetical protein